MTRRGGKVVSVRLDQGFMHEFDGGQPVDVCEDDRGLASRQLPRGLGRRRALPRRPRAVDPQPQLSLAEAGQACDDVHDDAHLGKGGVLCLAGGEGEGVLDDELRAQHLPGITRFRS